jgi:hypothetical protein
VQRHLAELEHQPRRITDALRVVQQGAEVLAAERTVLVASHGGLGEEMLAEVCIADLGQFGRRKTAQIGNGVPTRFHSVARSKLAFEFTPRERSISMSRGFRPVALLA